MQKKHRITLFIFISLLILISIDLYWSNYKLQVDTYEISSSKVETSFRIVQLSDIHDSEFGTDNKDLFKAVEDAEPDLILITGDLINNKKDINIEYVKNLISYLCKIAPVYISFGNQEESVQAEGSIDLYSLYSEAGGIVLDSDYIDILVNDQSIRLGGIYGYCEPFVLSEEENRQQESDFMQNFQSADSIKILMCHMPYSWLVSGSLYDWNVDAIFAGHVHGGQIRIPFIGGLWAPDQGWFPGRECGIYSTTESDWEEYRNNMLSYCKEQGYDTTYYTNNQIYETSYLILSRGLGNTDWVPRFNNIPEIVVVDFIPEQ